jgi:ATP-binding protein involved in chromosome partitioning
MEAINEEIILNSLKQIIDPDLGKDIVSLGFVRDVKINGPKVSLRIVLTTPACPVKDQMKKRAEEILLSIEGISEVVVSMDSEVPKGRGINTAPALDRIKNIIAVSSGKGGVGKSTVAVNIACSLAAEGAKVGLMDADIYGPNVPLMLGAAGNQPEIAQNKLIPIEAYGLKTISMALLVPPDKPMILRGPMLHGVIRQFLTDVEWGDLDYLIVDMPPGTGDAQLSLAQLVPVQGAVLVTTPQDVSAADVRRAYRMFETVNVPVLGIIENMSYFIAPDTGKRYDIFGKGGGEKLAAEFGIELLGQIPLGEAISSAGDAGKPVVISNPDSIQALALKRAAEEIARRVSIEAMRKDFVVIKRAKQQ